jgi:hypothetical protein
VGVSGEVGWGQSDESTKPALFAGQWPTTIVTERPARFRFAVRILAMDRPAGQGRISRK